MPVPMKKQNPDGGTEEARFRLFPEGDYDALVTAAVEGKSSKDHQDQLVLDVNIQHKGEDKILKYYVWYLDKQALKSNPHSDKQSWVLENMIDALGAEGDPDPLDETLLVGRRVVARVEHEDDEYKGKKRRRERINMLLRHPHGPVIPAGEQPAHTGAVPDDADDLPF